MTKLELYIRPGCPYCGKVLRFMNENKITIPLKDISDERNRQTLVKVGGQSQVPCLFIDGKPMYESEDIINYLKKNAK
jgi:glutaredoxin 3